MFIFLSQLLIALLDRRKRLVALASCLVALASCLVMVVLAIQKDTSVAGDDDGD